MGDSPASPVICHDPAPARGVSLAINKDYERIGENFPSNLNGFFPPPIISFVSVYIVTQSSLRLRHVDVPITAADPYDGSADLALGLSTQRFERIPSTDTCRLFDLPGINGFVQPPPRVMEFWFFSSIPGERLCSS